MKKIMIFTMILMPLIVLAMLFLTGNVVKYSTYLYVENIEFVEDSVVLNKPTDEQVSKYLTVNVYPMLANNKEVEFWSMDEDVVVVNDAGKITSVDFGETYIYAKSKENSTRTASCKVLVTSDHVHRVWVENPISELFVSQTHSLDARFAPKDAKNVALEFSSSNPSVLQVSATGELRALGKGKSTIKVELKSDPSINYSFEVTTRHQVKDIWIDSSPITSGKSTFTYPQIQFLPSEADEPVTYWSSDPSIASVNSSGQISFLRAGTVEIYARVDNFSKVLSKTYTSTLGYFTNVSFNSNNVTSINYQDWQNRPLVLNYSYEPQDANLQNLQLQSLNPEVVKVENGSLKVVGGGSAQIKLVAKTSSTQTVEATWTLHVARNAQSLEFNYPDFSYTTSKTLNLSVTMAPQDATENITLFVSDELVAQVENNTLSFNIATINNKFGKVQVTAQTPSGASKTITVAYIDKNIEQININSQSEFSFTMPLTGQAQKMFALVLPDQNLTDINLVQVSGNNVLSQNGYIFTLTDKGQSQIDVFLNGSTTKHKTIIINVARKVEAINNLTVTATWQNGNTQVFDEDDTIYASSKTFKFNYQLYPQNTTNQVANAQVVGDVASVSGNVVTFTGAGKISLVLSIDNVEKTIQIESTYMFLDSNTTVVSSLTLNKGQSVSIWEQISISPQNASRENVLWQVQGSAISIDSNGNILGEHGGNASILLTLKTSTQNITKQIDVFVAETAQSVGVVGDQYLFTQANTLNIANKFEFLPQTANNATALTFGSQNSSIATVDANGDVTFAEAGRCTIFAKLNSGAMANITIVYTGSQIVLSDASTYNVLHGTTVIVKPSTSALSSATYSQEFVSNSTNCAITKDVFVTVLGDATIEFNGQTFNIVCVDKMQSVSVLPNASDVNQETNKYVTGLSSLQLTTSVLGTASEFVECSLQTQNASVAQIDQTGLLTFATAGTQVITLTCNYTNNVYGAQGLTQSASVVIQSTCGQILSISALNNGVYTHTITNSPADNTIDVSALLQPYPSQIAISSNNVQLQSSNSNIASVNGLNLTLLKGGEANIDVLIQTQSGFSSATTLKYNVLRSATGIIVNGNLVANGDEILVHKSTIFITTQAYPQDANINNQISWQATSNNGVAEVDYTKKSIAFKKINEQLQITFTLGLGENASQFVVYFKTTRITYEIDVDSTTYIVPMTEPFTFVSAQGTLLNFSAQFSSNLNITALEDDVFVANASKVGTVDVQYNDVSKSVAFVATTNFAQIQNVKLKDVNSSGEQQVINTQANALSLFTASTQVLVDYTIPEGYDKFGNQISYTFSTNSPVAQISNNTVQFSTAGTATITLNVEYQDVYKTNTITYSFAVQSTHGKVSQFSINTTNYTYIYDNMTQSQKSINIANDLVRIAPTYGIVQSPSYQSQNSSIISVQNGVANVIGSGTTTVNVTWGTMVLPISFTIDKYVDGINITKNGTNICQIVTKASTYQIEYNLVVNNANFAPTLKQITFSQTSPNCAVDSQGIVTLNQANTKCQVTLTAQGGASATLTIIRVADNVNIIDVTAQTTSAVIKKDVSNILNPQFGKISVGMGTLGNNLQTINSDIGTFKGLVGTNSTSITLTNEQTINVTITEDVQGISFKADALPNNHTTALGAENQSAINLLDSYGAYVYPQTARHADGEYKIEYSVNSDIAYINNGLLHFVATGKVTIIFSAGGVSATRTIESTLGYAKSIQFANSERLVLYYNDQNYTIAPNFYQVFPSDATKADVTFTSSDSSVFTVNGNVLTFVGGGSANLQLSYKQSESSLQTITKEIYIVNKATGISFYDGDCKTGYMVTKMSKNATMQLNYMLESTGNLSPHALTFESSNQSVATVNNGILQFEGNGVTTITLKVCDLLNNASTFDAQAMLVIANNTNYSITSVSQNSSLTIETNDPAINILYPKPNASVNEFSYEVTSGQDVLAVDSNYGTIQELAGGEATIKITAKGANANNWTKTVSVYIHKKASINVLQTNVNTSLSSYTLTATVSPLDAFARKSIVLESSDTSVATVNTNSISIAQNISQQVTLLKKGSATITIKVMYNGQVETYKQVQINSTYHTVQSFDISHSQCTLYINDAKTITISNIKPADFNGTLSLTSSNSQAYSCTAKSGTSFEILALACGQGEIVVKYEGTDTFLQRISVTVLKYSEKVEIEYNGTAISNLNTFVGSIELTAVVTPLDASNRSVTWSHSANVTLQTCDKQNTVRVIFNSYGTAQITANATDGASGKTVTICYMQEIEDFNIYNGKNLVNSGETIYFAFNQNSITFTIDILPSNVVYNSFESDFTISCQHQDQTTITKNSQNQISIVAPSSTSQASYTDTITISYKNGKKVKTVILVRDVVQSIDFGDHTSSTDADYGLQKMRLFGNKSYYKLSSQDTSPIKNYYKMTVNVTPASAYNTLVWTFSANGVNNVTITAKDGYVEIDFHNLTTSASSVNNIYGNNFNNHTVTVTATNLAKTLTVSYTFHIVNGVNVFDADGFVNGSAEVVLHKNFGHSDQQSAIDQPNSSYVKLNAYANKTTVYGNGYLLSYAYRNEDESEGVRLKGGDKILGIDTTWAHTPITLTNAINVKIQGANYNASRDSNYFAELADTQKIAYCEIYNMYRAVEIGASNSTPLQVKNTLFRCFAHSAIIATNNQSVTRNICLENVIMFDVGQRAIEIQGAKDFIYVSGIFDVYNFQNSSSLKEVVTLTSYANKIISEAEKNNMAVEKLGSKWANVVCVASKDSRKRTDIIMFYQNGNQTIGDGVPGVSYVEYSGYKAWATKTNHDYIKWENEYDEKNSTSKNLVLNEAYLSGTSKKLVRV